MTAGGERVAPRFVPTLTDVVEAAPDTLAPKVAPPPVAIPPAAATDLEALLTLRVQAALRERLDQALRVALRELEPAVREAVAQALLEAGAGAHAAPGPTQP
ncbi:MAG: hypothetical protein OZ923_03350 [Comamonadaceae bacterium]|nr:hypothetical protein [Burkholderiales bacterium]MEB2347626.1 hypothetical protein [Comamonadaceae bacterium]